MHGNSQHIDGVYSTDPSVRANGYVTFHPTRPPRSDQSSPSFSRPLIGPQYQYSMSAPPPSSIQPNLSMMNHQFGRSMSCPPTCVVPVIPTVFQSVTAPILPYSISPRFGASGDELDTNRMMNSRLSMNSNEPTTQSQATHVSSSDLAAQRIKPVVTSPAIPSTHSSLESHNSDDQQTTAIPSNTSATRCPSPTPPPLKMRNPAPMDDESIPYHIRYSCSMIYMSTSTDSDDLTPDIRWNKFRCKNLARRRLTRLITDPLADSIPDASSNTAQPAASATPPIVRQATDPEMTEDSDMETESEQETESSSQDIDDPPVRISPPKQSQTRKDRKPTKWPSFVRLDPLWVNVRCEQDAEHRLLPYVSKPNSTTVAALKGVNRVSWQLVSEKIRSPLVRVYHVQHLEGGTFNNVYISTQPYCSCQPTATRDGHCKHMMFVFLFVLYAGRGSDILYQNALTQPELIQLFKTRDALNQCDPDCTRQDDWIPIMSNEQYFQSIRQLQLKAQQQSRGNHNVRQSPRVCASTGSHSDTRYDLLPVIYEADDEEDAQQSLSPLVPINDTDDIVDESLSLPQLSLLDRYAFSESPTVPNTQTSDIPTGSQFGATLPRELAPPLKLDTYQDFTKAVANTSSEWAALSKIDLNLAVLTILINLFPKQFGYKLYAHHSEKLRSLDVRCVYALNGRCRRCEQGVSHGSCALGGNCLSAFTAWCGDTDDDTKFERLYLRNTNNEGHLRHIERYHLDQLLTARRTFVHHCEQSNSKYIYSLIYPVRKTKTGRGRYKKHFRSPKPSESAAQTQHVHCILSQTNNSSQCTRKKVVKQLMKDIKQVWRGRNVVVQNPDDDGYFVGWCPFATTGDSDRCQMLPDGHNYVECIILCCRYFQYCNIMKLKCRQHAKRDISAYNKKLKLLDGCSLSRGIVRVGHAVMSPKFAIRLLKIYMNVKENMTALYKVVCDDYVDSFMESHSGNKYERSLVLDAVQQTIGKLDRFSKLVYSVMVDVVPELDQQLTTLLFTRSPRIFSIDQSWNRVSRMALIRNQSLRVGLITVCDDLTLFLRWYWSNDARENHENLSIVGCDVKCQQLLHGNLNVLRDEVTIWNTDNYDNNKELHHLIIDELVDQLKTNSKYKALQDKLDSAKFSIDYQHDNSSQCMMHLWQRVRRAAKEDGLSPKFHSDWHFLCQEDIFIMNSIQNGSYYLDQSTNRTQTATTAEPSDSTTTQEYALNPRLQSTHSDREQSTTPSIATDTEHISVSERRNRHSNTSSTEQHVLPFGPDTLIQMIQADDVPTPPPTPSSTHSHTVTANITDGATTTLSQIEGSNVQSATGSSSSDDVHQSDHDALVRPEPPCQQYVNYAKEWYHRHPELIQHGVLDQIYSFLKTVCNILGTRDWTARDTKMQALYTSDAYRRFAPIFIDIVENVPHFYQPQCVGIWINGQSHAEYEWYSKTLVFEDRDGVKVECMEISATNEICTVLLQFFGGEYGEYLAFPFLQPAEEYIHWRWHTLHRCLQQLIIQHDDGKRKPLAEYENVQKQLFQLSRAASIRSQIASRDDEMASLWPGAGNERIHRVIDQYHDNKSASIAPYATSLNITAEKLKYNVTVIDRIIASKLDAFSDPWKRCYAIIRRDYDYPSKYQEVEEEGLVRDLSSILENYRNDTKDVLVKRQIVTEHRRHTKRNERWCISRELKLLQHLPMITIPLLGHLYSKFQISLVTIIDICQRHGKVAGNMPDGTKITTGKNISKIYDIIHRADYEPISFTQDATANEAATTKCAKQPLFVDSSTNSNMYAVNTELALRNYNTIIKVITVLNENIASLHVSPAIVWRMNLNHLKTSDFVHHLRSYADSDVLWGHTLSVNERQQIATYLSNGHHFDCLLQSVHDRSGESVQEPSVKYYAKHRAPKYQKPTILLQYGGDPTTNPRKRRLPASWTNDGDQPCENKKKTQTDYAGLYAFDKDDIQYEEKREFQCACSFDIVMKRIRTKPNEKYYSWRDPNVCLDELKSMSLSDIDKAGAVKAKFMATRHGWRAKHGHCKAAAKDYLVAHLLKNKSIDNMMWENVQSLFDKMDIDE